VSGTVAVAFEFAGDKKKRAREEKKMRRGDI
jgi:hypothetical protein